MLSQPKSIFKRASTCTNSKTIKIKADADFTEAYYNRGTCYLALKDYKAALLDFTKALALDADFAKAYYSRATVRVGQNDFAGALPDLDKAIALDPKLPNALTLRGQILAQTNNLRRACDDFNSALQNGDPKALEYLEKYCKMEGGDGK